MFSSVTALRSELTARIVDAVPASWRVLDYITAPTEQLAPAAYIEFQQLAPSAAGQALPRGQMGAQVDVIVVDPRTADDYAEGKVEEHLVKVLAALDAHSDILWTVAAKQRLETGEFAWRINCTALVHLTTTPEEEE